MNVWHGQKKGNGSTFRRVKGGDGALWRARLQMRLIHFDLRAIAHGVVRRVDGSLLCQLGPDRVNMQSALCRPCMVCCPVSPHLSAGLFTRATPVKLDADEVLFLAGDAGEG